MLKKIMRYFSPIWDISTINCTFRSNIHAERSTRVFHLQNRQRNSWISIIRRFRRKLSVISFQLDIFVAAFVGKIHNGFRPVNPLHKKSRLHIDEFIVDPRTLGGYRRLIKIRRFCRDHMPSSRLPGKSKFVNKVESSAFVGIFREHLQN